LLVSSAAFTEPGAILDSAKMGALGSFAAALIAIPLGRMLRVKPSA
jgi:Na+:H+ antiporter, NhaA family